MEPIQQWCAYYIWDQRNLAEFLKVQMLAAASVGDSDLANRCAEKVQNILFPYMVRHRETRAKATAVMLKKLRGVEIKVKKAGWKLSNLKTMNKSIFGEGHG